VAQTILFMLQARDLNRAQETSVSEFEAGRPAPCGAGRPVRDRPLLGSLGSSKRWNGVRVEAGDEGLIVYRRSSGEGDWLCDLWLAARLAAALAG
jgi:hypothetical protein